MTKRTTDPLFIEVMTAHDLHVASVVKLRTAEIAVGQAAREEEQAQWRWSEAVTAMRKRLEASEDDAVK